MTGSSSMASTPALPSTRKAVGRQTLPSYSWLTDTKVLSSLHTCHDYPCTPVHPSPGWGLSLSSTLTCWRIGKSYLWCGCSCSKLICINFSFNFNIFIVWPAFPGLICRNRTCLNWSWTTSWPKLLILNLQALILKQREKKKTIKMMML